MIFNWLFIPVLISALVLFVIGRISIRRCRSFISRIGVLALFFVASIPALLFSMYYLWSGESLWFYTFRSLPYSELLAVGAGLFAGALTEIAAARNIVRPGVVIVILCGGLFMPYAKSLCFPVGKGQFVDCWKDDICMQSTRSSCGPASSATILKAMGYPVSEREVAEECYTSGRGTENWFIARAFRRRGLKVRYRVEKGFPVDLTTPAIAGVRVNGTGHFIPILGFSDGKYITGDPLVGRQQISSAQMETNFDFTGFFMEVMTSD